MSNTLLENDGLPVHRTSHESGSWTMATRPNSPGTAADTLVTSVAQIFGDDAPPQAEREAAAPTRGSRLPYRADDTLQLARSVDASGVNPVLFEPDTFGPDESGAFDVDPFIDTALQPVSPETRAILQDYVESDDGADEPAIVRGSEPNDDELAELLRAYLADRD